VRPAQHGRTHSPISDIFAASLLIRTLAAGPPLVFKVALRVSIVCRLSVYSPLSFLVSVRSLSLLLSLPFDAAARLSGLSLPPPRCCPLCVLSVSTPFSCGLHLCSARHSHSCGQSLATLVTTPHLMALLVSAHDLFMTWHACQNLPNCRTSLAFVFHFVCSETIFLKL
jgi:hypothetical protein